MNETKKLNILLADDDEDDRMIFGDIVQQMELNITFNTVSDGEQLIQKLTDCRFPLPDLIFLDLNMPNKNGKECLKEIKTHPCLKHLHVIIYSTSAAEKDVRDAYEHGASLYIQKPSNIKGLRKTLAKTLSMNWQNGHKKADKDSFLLKAKTALNHFHTGFRTLPAGLRAFPAMLVVVLCTFLCAGKA